LTLSPIKITEGRNKIRKIMTFLMLLSIAEKRQDF
jgi:hypothetical protein